MGGSSGGIYGTQSWGYMVGISGQFRTILTIFDPPLPPSYSIYGSLSDLRTLLSFDSPYTFNFRFASLLHTISAVSILLYPPPYSIPSPVISVVAIAVTEVPGIHFTLRFPLRFPLRFTNRSLLRFPLYVRFRQFPILLYLLLIRFQV